MCIYINNYKAPIGKPEKHEVVHILSIVAVAQKSLCLKRQLSHLEDYLNLKTAYVSIETCMDYMHPASRTQPWTSQLTQYLAHRWILIYVEWVSSDWFMETLEMWFCVYTEEGGVVFRWDILNHSFINK